MRTMKAISEQVFRSGLLAAALLAGPVRVFSQGSDHTCGAPNVHNPAVTYGHRYRRQWVQDGGDR